MLYLPVSFIELRFFTARTVLPTTIVPTTLGQWVIIRIDCIVKEGTWVVKQ